MGIDLPFRRLAEDKKYLEWSGVRHPLNPNPELIQDLKGVFFAGLKNGYHAPFFVSGQVDKKIQEYRSSNHRFFKRAPPGATHYSLSGTTKTEAGWDYKLQWWPKTT